MLILCTALLGCLGTGGVNESNCGERPIAVMWGVFPGREVLQPTVVDPHAFNIWKQEAFDLWLREWARLYPADSASYKVPLLPVRFQPFHFPPPQSSTLSKFTSTVYSHVPCVLLVSRVLVSQNHSRPHPSRPAMRSLHRNSMREIDGCLKCTRTVLVLHVRLSIP